MQAECVSMELRWPICLFRCYEDDPFLQCCSRAKHPLNVQKSKGGRR